MQALLLRGEYWSCLHGVSPMRMRHEVSRLGVSSALSRSARGTRDDEREFDTERGDTGGNSPIARRRSAPVGPYDFHVHDVIAVMASFRNIAHDEIDYRRLGVLR